jgi:protocatechuate 3,4-dioxygenase beta subunit
VDPYTHTTVLLITGSISSTSGASITQVTAADVAAVLQTVTSYSADVSTTATNVNTLVADLQSVVNNSADASNIIASIASPVGITGTVTDSSNNPIANIKIAVVTSVEWVTQAIIRTDAAGRYTVHAPAGDYVLAAINDTTSSTAASAWWTSGGGTTSMWSAENISVAGAMVTKAFKLVPGGRISGTVTAKANGLALNGLHIRLRDFTNGESLMNVRTGQDGTYNFNVVPGTYYISAMNGTVQPYATEVFNSPDGGTNMVQAQKIVIAAGDAYTANMSLLAGSKIEGTVTDASGSPIAGINVRVRDTTDTFFVEGQTTGLNGSYRFWLRPGIYSLRARGQTASNVDISAASTNSVVTFNAAVSQITAKLVDTNGNPANQAYAEVYDFSGTASTGSWLGYEHSNGDGSVAVYSNPATFVAILFKINAGDPIGSSIYLNKTQAGLATSVKAPISLGTVTLPAGGVLNGIVTKGVVPAAGALIQVRKGGKAYGTYGSNRFVNVRTMIDGSYTVSLPLNETFDRICAVDAAAINAWTTCTNAAVPGAPNGVWTAVDSVKLTVPATTVNFAY